MMWEFDFQESRSVENNFVNKLRTAQSLMIEIMWNETATTQLRVKKTT